MRKGKKERRKLLMSILAIILAFAMVLSLASPFFAAEIVNENITIEAEMGFDGNYRIGAITPVSVMITNNGENFKGEVQVKILQYKYDVSENYILYAQEVEIPTYGTKKIEFEPKFTTLQRKLEISLVENDKIIASKEIKCTPFASNDTMVGVLSDSSDEVFLSFMKNLKIRINSDELLEYEKSQGSVNSNQVVATEVTTSNVDESFNYGWNNKALNELLIFMEAKDFPNAGNILNNFNAIIINNFDTSKLNTSQLETLSNWIEDGGALILGTGINKDKVMKGLSSVLGEAENYGIRVRALGEEDTLISYKGNGIIIIHDFDLAYSEVSENSNASSILTNFYLGNANSLLNYNLNDKYSEDTYYDTYMLRNVPIEDTSSTPIMFVIAGLYIIFLGPILYIVLKKKDKLEKAWIIMPVLAVVAVLVLGIVSIKTPYKNYIVNTVSKIDLGNGGGRAEVDTGLIVFSPKQGDVEVVCEENEGISSPTNYYDTVGKENIIYKISKGENDKVTFYDNSNWSEGNVITIDNSFEINGSIDVKMAFEDGEIVIYTTNNLEWDLEDVILLLENSYVHYDKIAVGETQKGKTEIGTNTNYYILSRNIFGLDNYDTNMKMVLDGLITMQELRQKQRRRRLFEDFLYNRDNFYNVYSNNTYIYNRQDILASVRLYAFSNENIFGNVKSVNGKQPITYSDNVFTMNIPMDFSILSMGDEIEIPKGMLKVYQMVSDIEMDIYGGDEIMYMHNSGTAEFYFENPFGSSLKEFTLYWEKTYSGVPSLREIYNAKADIWQTLEEEVPYTLVEDYIDEGGNIRVRITVENGTEIYYPQISMKGGK